MKNLLTILLCLGILNSFAQHTNRQKKDLLNLSAIKHSGWMLAPGLTYMIPFKPKGDEAPEVDPAGKLAVYFELGRWHLFPGGGNVFNYYDYSLAYKRLSGREEIGDIKGQFKQNYVLGNFNINNIIQLTDYTFIQNSLGVNLDYKFSEKYEPATETSTLDNTKRLLFSLHYKIGYGIKVTKNLFIIPTLETPILNGREWEKGRSDYGILSSRYRPLIFSVRFAWTRKPGKGDCPPVYDPANGKNGQNFDDMLQME
ncbi:hypothetical protein [Parvicella tangerina]|uniref:Outer membrane protein beta-barrel domain-containing protein n=1 Tax=Parvicella tangerina TaxID=2829795 RepID=A0A916N996_9FLAO|nr:hypothetical protein [Parvicella tangerina]CAG5078538.1 hypothetical protein CRYO30217_00702 [Parvicella tangerina]